MLAAWQRSRSPQAAMSTRYTDRQFETCKKLLGLFIHYHLDIDPTARNLAFGIPENRYAYSIINHGVSAYFLAFLSHFFPYPV